MFVFFTVEPTVGRATITSEFTVTQEIIDEISFLVEAADVTMVGSLQGLTGGYATGTTYTVVRTNDPDGYSMFLAFSSSTAMNNRDFPNLFFINNYSLTATTVPDYDWVEDGTSAEFGYTVSASTTLDLYRYFLDNGTNCNIPGGGDTLNKCWMTPSSTDLVVGDQIINRTTASTDGATTTLKFRVVVPSNPSPSLPSGFYVATATLTATNNP
jgi:hypothetical protein